MEILQYTEALVYKTLKVQTDHRHAEGREFDSCHFLLTSRSILYDKAQPLKATQLLDLYHGVNEPMALPAVAHGSKSQ